MFQERAQGQDQSGCVTLKSTDVDLMNSAQLRALDSMRGAPPAALILKVGARVVVTRNLDVHRESSMVP